MTVYVGYQLHQGRDVSVIEPPIVLTPRSSAFTLSGIVHDDIRFEVSDSLKDVVEFKSDVVRIVGKVYSEGEALGLLRGSSDTYYTVTFLDGVISQVLTKATTRAQHKNLHRLASNCSLVTWVL